jgi:hypothetical protein
MHGDVERSGSDGGSRHLRAVADDVDDIFAYINDDGSHHHDGRSDYYCCSCNHRGTDDASADDHSGCYDDAIHRAEHDLHDARNAYGVPWDSRRNTYRGCAASVADALRQAVLWGAIDFLKRHEHLVGRFQSRRKHVGHGRWLQDVRARPALGELEVIDVPPQQPLDG